MTRMRIDHSVVLIIGASGGLGQAIAHTFAQAGARLALSGRNEALLADMAQRLGGASIHADLTDRESLTHQRDAVLAQYGRVDLVINATGYGMRKPFEMHTPAELEMIITSESVFWVGGLLLGKAVISKFRDWWQGAWKCFFPSL